MAVGTIADVRPWQNPVAEEMRGRQFGVCLGFVRDRADPLKLGRVRVQCPAVLRERGQLLDWCYPACAGIAVPPLGAAVIIQFELGIVTHGVYTWGWRKGTTIEGSDVPNTAKGLVDSTWLRKRTVSSGGFGVAVTATLPDDTSVAAQPEYPYVKAFESEGGFILELDDSPVGKRARLYHPSGTTVLIDKNGTVQIRSKGAQYHYSEGDYVVALGEGASFKVVYPGGSGISVGPRGTAVSGHQVQILGRTVIRSTEAI